MTTQDAPREWHAWSVWKSQVLLAGYLSEFVRAGKRSRHRVFIDCFAGSNDNVEFGTGRELPGSPRIALSVAPQFTHLLFFELPERASQLATSLKNEFPDRELKVISGDCNLSLEDGLDWIKENGNSRSGPHLGQALAFLDPDSLELEWETVVKLASWQMSKNGSAFIRRNRIELLILFPTGPMRRQLSQPPRTEATEKQKLIIDRLFGGEDWRSIYDAQRQGKIKGEDSWLHYVSQYRLQLTNLGYEFTAAIEVRNTGNVVMYHMIFATSNDTGKKIMKSVLAKASEILPKMIDDEKSRRRGSGPRLFQESEAELEKIKADPGRWARLFAERPKPFDIEALVAANGKSHESTQFQPQLPFL
jgi:three-Cys-motif partner protein